MNREEAIKIVRSHYPANKQMLNEALEFLIPELKEDEDELTWLINYISKEAYCLSMDIRDKEDSIKVGKLQKSLAWLKKQAEVKLFEWTEEDSVRLQRIIDFLWYNRKGDTDTIYQQEQDIDWLKSLKDRVQPKQYKHDITESNF